MTVLEALSSQISSNSRSRGAHYFQTGAVRSLTSEHGVVHATVRGSIDYDVWIEPQGALIRASCTCPYFDDRLDMCKHIWAAVLAAIDQQLPLVEPGTPPAEISFEPALRDDEFDDDDFVLSPASRRPESKTSPAWKKLLDAVDAQPDPASPQAQRFEPGQILYVVDVAASLGNNALVLMLMTRDRKRSGEWGKPHAARISSVDIDAIQDSSERHALERLVGGRPYDTATSWNYGYNIDLSQLQLRGAPVRDLVPQLCALGTCMVRMEVISDVRLEPHTTDVEHELPRGVSSIEHDLARGARTALTAAVRRREIGIPPTPKPEIVYTPIAWDDGSPWVFRMNIERSGAEGKEGDTASRDGWNATANGWR